MVSAICPLCHIILVEASSASTADLGTGVNAAVSAGRQVRVEQLRRLRVVVGQLTSDTRSTTTRASR